MCAIVLIVQSIIQIEVHEVDIPLGGDCPDAESRAWGTFDCSPMP